MCELQTTKEKHIQLVLASAIILSSDVSFAKTSSDIKKGKFCKICTFKLYNFRNRHVLLLHYYILSIRNVLFMVDSGHTIYGRR